MDAELTDERRRVDRSTLPQRISHKKKREKCIFSRLEIRFFVSQEEEEEEEEGPSSRPATKANSDEDWANKETERGGRRSQKMKCKQGRKKRKRRKEET